MNGRVCHHMMLAAGFLDELNADQLNLIQKGLNVRVKGLSNELFPHDTDPVITGYIERFYPQMVKENRIDVRSKSSKNKEWQTIDMNSIRNKDIREVGVEWLCYQAIRQLNIDTFLESQGWEQDEISLAITHLISRAVYPASEYKTGHWIRENSAVCEITGYDVQKITKDRLYNISHALYAQKESLEYFLSHRTNELFDL